MYTADSRNIHSVDEITDGERLTLTLWFSRDASHNEDAKLVSLLSQFTLNYHDNQLYFPVPASSNMYWFTSNNDPHRGCDIRLAKLLILGFDLYLNHEDNSSLEFSPFDDIAELLMKPLKLVRRDEMFAEEFVNVLHALQVVQFYLWKESDLRNSEVGRADNNVIPLSQALIERVAALKHVLMKDMELVEASSSYSTSDRCRQHSFDWARLSVAAAAWKAYAFKLQKELSSSLHQWKIHQSIFVIPSAENEE